jgi:cobalt-zinc-cadmium efflux system membrane fusion protein
MFSLELRRGRLLWGGVVGLALAAVGVAAFVFGLGRGHTTDAQTVQPVPIEPISQVRREGHLLVVPSNVQKALRIETAFVAKAKQTRALPAMSGRLALDNTLMARIPPHFPSDVVALGTVKGKETDAFTADDAPEGRILRFGDRVKKGQLLAVLWSRDVGEKKSEFVDTVVRLKYEQDQLEQLEQLLADLAISRQTVLDARAKVVADELVRDKAENTLLGWGFKVADLDVLRAEAERRLKPGAKRTSKFAEWARVEIRSPQDGVIVEMNVSLGSRTNDPTIDLFKIADNTRLALWANVYEDDLPAVTRMLKKGPLAAGVELPAEPGNRLKATVDYVGEIIDPSQNTALLRGTVPNPDGELKSGQYVTVHVELPATADEVEIPTSALVEDGKDSYVFVQPNKNEMKFERRKVAVSRRFQDVVYLQGSLQPGDAVVISGALLLNEQLNELTND